MSDVLVWPYELLVPRECSPYLVPFTRSGGRTLGGLKPSYRTDIGHWRVDLVDVALATTAQKRTWNAIDAILGGASGRIAVPAYAMDTAPFVGDVEEKAALLPHSDGTLFSDGAGYLQSPISVVSVGTTAIGARSMKMRIIEGVADLSGVRFSFEHALYETGQVTEIDGDIWTLNITPSVRALIPDGADLEFYRPTCICQLSEDTGLQRSINANRFEQRSVSFVEDTLYWSELAG